MKIAFAGSEGFSIKVLDHLLLNITNLVSLQFVITLIEIIQLKFVILILFMIIVYVN